MAQVTIGPQTLGSLKAMITRFHKEDEDDQLLTDAANDAIESLWRNVLLVSLSQFMGGPITTLNIAAGSERATIVSISDPTTVLIPTEVPGGTMIARAVEMAYSLVTESGSETLMGPTIVFNIDPAFLLSVPPPVQLAGNSATSPIGWNIYTRYVGGVVTTPGRWAKQNAEPLTFAMTFVEPADTGISDGPEFPPPPTSNTTGDNIYFIRQVQVQNTDGTWKTWQQGDIDGLMMERASRSIASASTYQSYGYDVLNGSTIEVRPATGQALNPRYFYVIKPRRLLFNNAPLPFSNLSYIEYLKLYAEGQLDLSNKEYVGYGIKSKAAARVLQEIVLGLNTQATTKQKSITPYFQW